MRSLRLCAAYGSGSLSLLSYTTVAQPSLNSPLPRPLPPLSFTSGFYTKRTEATATAAAGLTCSRRWYATAAEQPTAKASSTTTTTTTTTAASTATTGTANKTTFARLSTASEAAAELQHWTDTATVPSSGVVLSGKSLVLCVAALQLRAAQHPTSSPHSEAGTSDEVPLVQRYLTTLARHVYTQCNAADKPRAAWRLMEDVENGVIRADALHTSVHFLQHHAFENATASAKVAAADYEDKCAARDLELTFEAVETLLAGRQISEIHRTAAASAEIGSPSTTAAMVPPAEAAAFYIGNVVRLTRDPLSGCADGHPAAPSPFLAMPPAKQQFWTQAAQQLTTVLYLALLITNTSTMDAQLVNAAFRDAVRRVYGVPTDRFGVVRSMHYMVTVALPYVVRSFSTIFGVVRAQQEQAAKEATAAAKADHHRSSTETKVTPTARKATTTTTSTSTSHGRKTDGKGSGSGTGTIGLSSDRMNKLTLVVVCIAAALYVASSNTELLYSAEARTAAGKEGAQEGELRETYQKLSAMAASATAPQKFQNEEAKSLANALPKK